MTKAAPFIVDASAAGAPRASASVAIVRDAAPGIEVLLLRRAERSGDHTSGAWVFPGGIVEPSDGDASDLCTGRGDAKASRCLQLPHGGLAYYVAALRECFEECGLLYATDPGGDLVRLDDPAPSGLGARVAAWRGALHDRTCTLAELCGAFGLTLAPDRLVYISHWLTPLARKRRFDTRFFIAAAPAAQVADFDGVELLEQCWMRPAAALVRSLELKLLPPTRKTLELIGSFDSVDALLAWARTPRAIMLTLPRDAIGRDGPCVVLPDEPAWAELGRVDPLGRGTGCCEIQIGVPVRLSPRVIRVTADNGSAMSGPGTNTYLVGGGERNEWAVIDPGPRDRAHVAAILAAAPGPIRWIFATHTHLDHSPATALLKADLAAAAMAAVVYGCLPAHRERQDTSFAPDVQLRGGERFELVRRGSERTTLQVIHTPGHASNHLCYLLEEEGLLFTGDHVMQGATVVIDPPDGDMAAYLRSLGGLATFDLEWLAPGHGFLMAQPHRVIEAVIAHRLQREAKVIDALQTLGSSDPQELLATVYADVRPELRAVAMRSLLAHLFKLCSDGAAFEQAGRWELALPA